MGFLNIFGGKKKPEPEKVTPDFTDVDMEKARELAKAGTLAPLYLMPLRFGGDPAVESNAVYAPPVAVALKDRCDDMVEDLLRQEKVNGYACTPEYKGKSVVPSRITVVAKLDGKPVFTESVEIW